MSRGSGGLAGTALACAAVLGVITIATVGAVAATRQDTTHAGDVPEPTPQAGPLDAPCPPPADPGERGAPLVAFVGDSTTALAALPSDLAPEGAIAAVFAGDYDIRVEAQFGRTIGDMVDEVEAVVDDAGGPPDVLVVNLGTNDALQGSTEWPAAFDELLSLVADHPCVLLVTVNETIDALVGPTSSTAASINARIAEAVTAPNLFHVDWNEDYRPEGGFTPEADHLYSVYAPPEALPPELRATHPMGMWVSDGVHQSPEGSVELATRIREVLDQVSGSAAPVP
jgi:lysophospholipase L1-like esterase